MSDLFDGTIAEPEAPYQSPVRWVPDFLLDETCPEARETPDHWLIRDGEGWLVGEVDDAETERRSIAIGETMVFGGLQEFGNVEVEVHADGTHELLQDLPHPKADFFWEMGDPDTISESVEMFARSRAGSLREDEEETIVLSTHRWDDTTFRLVAGLDGVTFVPVDAEETVP